MVKDQGSCLDIPGHFTVYNEMLLKDREIKIFEINPDQMNGMGTPEDLVDFEKTEAFKAIRDKE